MPIVIDLPVDTSLPASVCLSNTSEWTLADVTQWYRPPPPIPTTHHAALYLIPLPPSSTRLVKSELEEFVPNLTELHATQKLCPDDPVNIFGVDVHTFVSKLKPGNKESYNRLTKSLKILHAESF
jgi:hypothetical protein